MWIVLYKGQFCLFLAIGDRKEPWIKQLSNQSIIRDIMYNHQQDIKFMNDYTEIPIFTHNQSNL